MLNKLEAQCKLGTQCKLGQLLKYEFRYYFRIFLPLYIVMMLIALAARFEMILRDVEIPLLINIYGAVIVSLLVIIITFIIQRFTDNFLKDPGSLMFTLPVTVWSLTASKAIAAFSMILLSGLAVLVSALVYVMGIEKFHFDLRIDNPASLIITVFIALFMIIQQLCLIYTAITASHILPRFRIVAGFAIYFAVMYFVERTIYRLAGGFEQAFSSDVSFMIGTGVPVLVATAALAALFFWTTGFLLKRSYNLE